MHQRVREEIELLKKQFRDLEHGDQLDWVLIPELVLPDGRFNKASTKVLFKIPVGYPQTGPDNFFVDADLRLKDGSNPQLSISVRNRAAALPPLREIGAGFRGIRRTGVQQRQSKAATICLDSFQH